MRFNIDRETFDLCYIIMLQWIKCIGEVPVGNICEENVPGRDETR